MIEVARIDRAFPLGKDAASHRVGTRRLIKALLDQLEALKNKHGCTPKLMLEARLCLCVVAEAVPFDTLERSFAFGTSRAGHRLGLRDIVAELRQRLEARVAEHGFGAELSLDVHTKLLHDQSERR